MAAKREELPHRDQRVESSLVAICRLQEVRTFLIALSARKTFSVRSWRHPKLFSNKKLNRKLLLLQELELGDRAEILELVELVLAWSELVLVVQLLELEREADQLAVAVREVEAVEIPAEIPELRELLEQEEAEAEGEVEAVVEVAEGEAVEIRAAALRRHQELQEEMCLLQLRLELERERRLRPLSLTRPL